MAQAGWDSVTLDLQHGLLDYTQALPMLQAISAAGVLLLVRVPWNEPSIIKDARYQRARHYLPDGQHTGRV
jgi:4-hydroxy-2-oxoheptanedioate aldolase